MVGRTQTRRSPVWWLLLGLTVLTFVTLSLPRYLALDPAQSRVTSEHAWHHPLLVTHVVCGSIAILAAVLQVWPWLRRSHPALHRRVGRAYVFAGVWPARAAPSRWVWSPRSAASPRSAMQITSGVTAWLSWTIALVASQLVLDRIERQVPPRTRRGANGGVPTAAVR